MKKIPVVFLSDKIHPTVPANLRPTTARWLLAVISRNGDAKLILRPRPGY
jgi:hypothetical protein